MKRAAGRRKKPNSVSESPSDIRGSRLYRDTVLEDISLRVSLGRFVVVGVTADVQF
jgi:hypothetical protein